MDPHEMQNTLAFEGDNGSPAEYEDFDCQVELSPDEAAKHRDFVRRVGEKFGFPLPKWKPTIPRHTRG